MIIDKIENHKLYSGLDKKIERGFEYINTTNLKRISLGEHEIDGDDVFAIVMEYDTRGKDLLNYEGHHKYIDLQFMITGKEFIGTSTLTNQIPVETNSEKDYDLYELDSNLIEFSEGMFMIFFPDDLHMPGAHINQVSEIRKLVIKIKV